MEEEIQYPSLLDFASKEAFGCDDYEAVAEEEDASNFLVTPDDALHTILEKATRIGERILDGKSIAVALGEMKDSKKEGFEVKNLTFKERHIWQQWKRGRGALPQMTWQFQSDSDKDQHQDEEMKSGKSITKVAKSTEEGQKRKGREGVDDIKLPPRKQAKIHSKRLMKITIYQQEALGEMYYAPDDIKEKVTAVDVLFFLTSFPQLSPLLNALTKMSKARSEYKSNIATEEQKTIESHCTSKAIYMIEKQMKWIMEQACSTVRGIEEQVTLMRGRVAAIEGQGDLEEEDEYDTSSIQAESIDEEQEVMIAKENVKGIEKSDVAQQKDNAQDEEQVRSVFNGKGAILNTIISHTNNQVIQKEKDIQGYVQLQHTSNSIKSTDGDIDSQNSPKKMNASPYAELSDEERDSIKDQIAEEELQFAKVQHQSVYTREAEPNSDEEQVYQELHGEKSSDFTLPRYEMAGQSSVDEGMDQSMYVHDEEDDGLEKGVDVDQKDGNEEQEEEDESEEEGVKRAPFQQERFKTLKESSQESVNVDTNKRDIRKPFNISASWTLNQVYAGASQKKSVANNNTDKEEQIEELHRGGENDFPFAKPSRSFFKFT